MMRLSTTLLASLLAATASAQGTDPLVAAEQAYMEVDFERTAELARAALASGQLTHDRLVRVYELLGVSLAAQGEEEASRDAYVKMLALDPEATVDTNLAPRLRSPFMEARGFWATRSDSLDVDVTLVRARRGLRIQLNDPLDMAVEIRVLTRVHGTYEEMDEERLPAAPSHLVEVEGLPEVDQIEYVVQVLDGDGNRILERGTEDVPNVVGREPQPVGAPVEGGAAEGGGGAPTWLWVALGVVAAAGLGVGLYYGLRETPVELQSGVTFR